MRSKLAIRFVIVAFAAALLYSALTGKRYWPFVPFSMYAVAPFGGIRLFILEGVDDRGQSFPFSTNSYFEPYTPVTLQKVLRDSYQEGRFETALRGLEALYLRRRASGAHHGPPLLKLRAYVGTWDPDLADWHTLPPPLRKTLVREVN